jgi:hypothetical protein
VAKPPVSLGVDALAGPSVSRIGIRFRGYRIRASFQKDRIYLFYIRFFLNPGEPANHELVFSATISGF